MDLQQRIVDWIAAHSRAVSIAWVLFMGIGGSIATASVPLGGSERAADWFAYLLVWGAAVCVFWYRTRPLPAVIACVAFTVTYWVLDYPGTAEPAMWLLFYAATRHGGDDRQRVWRVVAACLGVIVAIAVLGVVVPTEDLPAIAIVGIFVIHGTFAMIGEALYQRSRYVEQLEQRAAALEADMENKAALAAVEERTRIAREMHDIIAHGMSTVVVQAQAAQSVVDTNPTKAREVLETIENIGRTSVDEMRRMLGVLRNEHSDLELEPQPGLGDIEELRKKVEVAGVELELSVTGDHGDLPPSVELTMYRIVQEALTNVLRHAGRPVKVVATVDCSDDELTISVTDDGLGAAASTATAGSGHGLRGMRERVEIYNGTFSAGSTPGGGYGVHATLPRSVRVAT